MDTEPSESLPVPPGATEIRSLEELEALIGALPETDSARYAERLRKLAQGQLYGGSHLIVNLRPPYPVVDVIRGGKTYLSFAIHQDP